MVHYGADPPDLVEKVLCAARCIRACSRLEIRFDGELAATLADFPPITAAEYGQDLIAIEQYAGDLAVVQNHCNQFFAIPEYIQPGERVSMRIARLLVEGHLVASPNARTFTMDITTDDSEDLRRELRTPRPIAWRAETPYSLTSGGRTLTIGPVYAVHTAATAINAEEAIEALEAGRGKGFRVTYRPGDDPFFYVALADGPVSELGGKKIALWSLVGIDQPGVAANDTPNAGHSEPRH
ncbi:hypothetical protein AO501_33920 [Mycobacterium gordonae]|uniref:Uncharacterized protein n=1 Tax=Mycobacterium gordonae TaxID=1778 RepID=A0A0Q2MJS7_MYCGO|nr:hypothetical protein AO501_33920 [Mycobacterium gordonae]